jgi:hypothetical protein
VENSKNETKGVPTAHPFELGATPPNPNILPASNPGTTNIHIENLQINLNMGNATNVNGVPIEERIKALRNALKPKNGTG